MLLAHVKWCEASTSTSGNGNDVFLCHPGGLKELNRLEDMFVVLAPPSLWGRELFAYVELGLPLGFIPGFIALPIVYFTCCPLPSSSWLLMRIWLYPVLSPTESFAFVQHFFVLVIQTNSLLSQYFFISRRASQFRTSSAALVPSGGNREDGKIKKINRTISLWKTKQLLRWSKCVYQGAGLCIHWSCCWDWESGRKDPGYPNIRHICFTDLQENYVLCVSQKQQGMESHHAFVSHFTSMESFHFNEKGEISRTQEMLMQYLSHSMSTTVVAGEYKSWSVL